MTTKLGWTIGALLVLGGGGLACTGGDGGGDGGSDDGGCPGGVCLPTETPGDGDGGPGGGTVDDGPDPDGTADSGDTGMLPPDGVCDETACDPWDINDPPDGNASRACADPDCETTTGLPALDENFFRCQVMAVFQEGCANLGCHSPMTEARQLRLYARFQAREFPIHSGTQDEEVIHDCSSGELGNPTCERHPMTALEWATNFDSARLFAIDLAASEDSQLLTQPLANDPAGLEHAAVDNWANTNDVRYQTILSWLDGATDSASCNAVPTPPVVGSEDNTVGGYFQFSCPECRTQQGTDNCVASGETAPICDPTACLP